MKRSTAAPVLSDCDVEIGGASMEYDYDIAFSRHRGLISPDEQRRLLRSRVAIVGMGGVGGIHLVTLARLGIGGFHIADPDTFELVNFNRQQGATIATVGRNKAEVMAEQARLINPGLDLEVFPEPIHAGNVGRLLDGVDLLVDGIDFFAIETRRLIFAEARKRGIWGITAGPLGFSGACLTFSPTGMSFDEYFDLRDGMDKMDQLVAFIAGLAPRATHRAYLDASQVDPKQGRGPSAGLACQLCAGIAAAQAVKILLKRPGMRPAPHYFQFDAYLGSFKSGRLWFGNANPWQKLKRTLTRRAFEKLGWKVS